MAGRLWRRLGLVAAAAMTCSAATAAPPDQGDSIPVGTGSMPRRGQPDDPLIVDRSIGRWLALPSPQEIVAAEPRDVTTMAYAQLSCGWAADGSLTNCWGEYENPPGHGLARALMSLVPKFRLDTASFSQRYPPARVEVRMSWVGFGGDCLPPLCSPIPPPPPPPHP